MWGGKRDRTLLREVRHAAAPGGRVVARQQRAKPEAGEDGRSPSGLRSAGSGRLPAAGPARAAGPIRCVQVSLLPIPISTGAEAENLDGGMDPIRDSVAGMFSPLLDRIADQGRLPLMQLLRSGTGLKRT